MCVCVGVRACHKVAASQASVPILFEGSGTLVMKGEETTGTSTGSVAVFEHTAAANPKVRASLRLKPCVCCALRATCYLLSAVCYVLYVLAVMPFVCGKRWCHK